MSSGDAGEKSSLLSEVAVLFLPAACVLGVEIKVTGSVGALARVVASQTTVHVAETMFVVATVLGIHVSEVISIVTLSEVMATLSEVFTAIVSRSSRNAVTAA